MYAHNERNKCFVLENTIRKSNNERFDIDIININYYIYRDLVPTLVKAFGKMKVIHYPEVHYWKDSIAILCAIFIFQQKSSVLLKLDYISVFK